MKPIETHELLAYAAGDLESSRRRERIAEALAASEALRAELDSLTAITHALREREVPPSSAVRKAELVETAVAEAGRRASSSLWPRRLLMGFSFATAVALIGLFLYTPNPPRARLQAGTLQVAKAELAPGDAVPQDTPVRAVAGTAWKTRRGSRVQAVSDVRLSSYRESERETRVGLEEGALRFTVAAQRGGRFAVTTPDAEVTVQGTVFTVRRVAGATETTVSKGRVRVRDLRSGQVELLGAGESSRVGPEDQPAGEPEQLEPEPEATVRSPAPSHRDIRRALEKGRVDDARRLLRRARHQAKRPTPEMILVGAEVELAVGKVDAALRSYLSVARDFPNAPQAESAFFAAAQLARSHPTLGRDASELLREYLERYPRGKYALDAERLLRRTD